MIEYHGNPVSLKKSLLSVIEKKLKKRELDVARSDWHAKRKPIGCGLTIHPGVGCPLQCSYCYVYDMGFNKHATPYSLSGMQLIAALLHNKYFYPSIWGTYLAFGSVTEPFLPAIRSKTLEYLKSVAEYLGNPCQVSTKVVVPDEVIEEIASFKNLRLSILITVTSLKQYRNLEKNAPDPYDRLYSIKTWRKRGFKPFVFLRPLLPGLSMDEIDELVNQAKEVGAYGIVVGNLRLSTNVLRRLVDLGLRLDHFKKVINKGLKRGFIDVRVNDGLLSSIKRRVLEKGLIFLKRACCANTVTQYLHGLTESICPTLCFLRENVCEPSCPSQCRVKALGEPRHLDTRDIIESLLGLSSYEVKESNIIIKLKRRIEDHSLVTSILSHLLRRKILIKNEH
ncbi:MAG: radical SAM protein [Candidatus Nezhaarchaeota archaeon]|nr:radical SAM protein [Candidatus Nezhaarchaeota archaeon]MCX8141907.1 radical SAM protein [Candidatus Nezhaarchaeota archaeon]MDW8050312.1 radical SAM protein [Nitrososphaerota archaeon]